MRGAERGLSGSVQVTLLLPFTIGIFLLALQWAMLSWADATARAAAEDGARVAAEFGSSAEHGKHVALGAAGNGSLSAVSAVVERGAGTTEATVSGRALAVVPFFPVDVQRTASVPTERLTQR